MALIRIRGVSKAYGGVQALHPLDLDLFAGEVHAVCGENGAGKSTLNRFLSGTISPDSGTVLVDGLPMPLGSVRRAEAAGIAIVHQESAAFLELSASENHEIMREPGHPLWLDRAEMDQHTATSLAELAEGFDPAVPLEERSLAQRQMVAIARAISGGCRLLILDEPTASLSTREIESLFAAIRKLRAQGVGILYVSHRLDEVFALADRVTVLRDGRLVGTQSIAETTPDGLIQQMVGRTIEASSRSGRSFGEVRLQVEGLSGGAFRDVSFSVRAGEVVALAGLVGAGRSEVARAIFGIDPRTSGRILADGAEVASDPQAAMQAGIAFAPEDRQHEGLHLPLSVRDNLMMAAAPGLGTLVGRGREVDESARLVGSLAIKTASDLAPVSSLSGGNQQKVLLGKWLAHDPRILILDEPTRGVDVGSKDQVHRLIQDLADRGLAVLVISSELNEVLTVADRVLVMRQGQLAGELSREEASQEKILALALPSEQEVEAPVVVKRPIRRELAVGALLLLTVIAATVTNPGFASADNLRDMLVRIAPAVIVGSAMTLVIQAREIDISVGSLMGLCAAVLGIAASTDRMGLPVPVAIAACLGVGVVGGVLNGVLTAYAKIPSIIVTLGTLSLYRGVTEIAMGGKWIENMPPGLRSLGTGNGLGLPWVVWVAVLFAAGGLWVTRRTRLGLRILALGSNPSAAALAGVQATRTKLLIFGLAGFAAAVAALFSATQLQVVESGFGSGFELVAIASVIVGGTSIRGGRGTMVGTVLGAALLGIVSTVLIFLRLGESATHWERAIQGGFILAAVLGDSLSRRARRSA